MSEFLCHRKQRWRFFSVLETAFELLFRFLPLVPANWALDTKWSWASALLLGFLVWFLEARFDSIGLATWRCSKGSSTGSRPMGFWKSQRGSTVRCEFYLLREDILVFFLFFYFACVIRDVGVARIFFSATVF